MWSPKTPLKLPGKRPPIKYDINNLQYLISQGKRSRNGEDDEDEDDNDEDVVYSSATNTVLASTTASTSSAAATADSNIINTTSL